MSTAIGVGAQSTSVAKHFCPKINRIPEFYATFVRIIFSTFWRGGDAGDFLFSKNSQMEPEMMKASLI